MYHSLALSCAPWLSTFLCSMTHALSYALWLTLFPVLHDSCSFLCSMTHALSCAPWLSTFLWFMTHALSYAPWLMFFPMLYDACSFLCSMTHALSCDPWLGTLWLVPSGDLLPTARHSAMSQHVPHWARREHPRLGYSGETRQCLYCLGKLTSGHKLRKTVSVSYLMTASVSQPLGTSHERQWISLILWLLW